MRELTSILDTERILLEPASPVLTRCRLQVAARFHVSDRCRSKDPYDKQLGFGIIGRRLVFISLAPLASLRLMTSTTTTLLFCDMVCYDLRRLRSSCFSSLDR